MAKKKSRGGLPPDKYLSDTQLKKLRQYVKDMADLARQRGSERAIIDELIVELLANTGLRASELCDLNIEDLPKTHDKDSIWVRDGKGKVTRVVDIPDSLVKRIERFVKLYRKDAEPKEPLLQSSKGKRMIYRTIYEKVKKLGNKSGIGKLHPHMLRHTYLTRLYNVEHDLRFVQDQAGHASPTTTAIYAKTNSNARQGQAKCIGCLPKLSGSMPAERGQRLGLASVTMTRFWATMLGLTAMPTVWIRNMPIRWERRDPILGACMTCTAMSESGAVTGTKADTIQVARPSILMGLHRAGTVVCVATAGTTMTSACVALIAGMPPRIDASPVWVSV